MLHTLVIPLDGSNFAERALPYAVRLAQARAGRLILARVAVPVPPRGWDAEGPQSEEIARAQDYLASVAEGLANRDVAVETITPYGHAAAEILQLVEDCGADGVVMTTHGRTGLEHLMHGSVAEAVLARSAAPVFLVGGRPGEGVSPFDPSSARILVALDGSPFAEAAVPAALDILGPSNALRLLRVVAPSGYNEFDPDPLIGSIEERLENVVLAARSYLNTVAGQIALKRPEAHVEVDVRVGDAAPGIVQAAHSWRADLVVMATHGRTGVGRAVLGSVAGAVLREGTLPMLLVRAPTHQVTAQADRPETAAPASIVTL